MNLFIRSYYTLYFENVCFISKRRACAMCLGSKKPLCLGAPHTFTNTEKNHELQVIS